MIDIGTHSSDSALFIIDNYDVQALTAFHIASLRKLCRTNAADCLPMKNTRLRLGNGLYPL